MVLDAFLPTLSFGFLRTQTLPSHMYLLDCGEDDSEKHPKMFEKYKAIIEIENMQYNSQNFMLYVYIYMRIIVVVARGYIVCRVNICRLKNYEILIINLCFSVYQFKATRSFLLVKWFISTKTCFLCVHTSCPILLYRIIIIQLISPLFGSYIYIFIDYTEVELSKRAFRPA